jgi:long-chain fatty acid transport protein
MKTTRFFSVTTAAAAGTFITLALPGDASAAGYALDVLSARGTGMAGATGAMIDDSSSIFYNPAGIAQGKVLDAQVGVTLVAPSFSYTSPSGEKTSLPFAVVPPPHLYVSGGITDDLSIGVGVFTPYGLTIKWPDGWAGRQLITQSSLATFYINPTVAYKIGPLRIGAGFQLVRGTVELKQDIRFGDQTGSADLGSAAWGAGGNVGIQLEAIKQYLSFGVQYRSAVKLKFDDGKAHFSNVPAALSGAIHDQAVTTSVVLPDQLTMGVATHPVKKLVIDFDAVWIQWSYLRSIDLTFPNDASGSLNKSLGKNWHDTVNFHLGAEGELSDHWLLRGGVLVDPSPSPANTLTPDLPDATRVNLALGGTWRHESGVHVDVGYQFILLTGKTSTVQAFPGDYGGFAQVLGITIGYATPKAKEASNWVDPAGAGGEVPPPPPVDVPTTTPAPSDAPPVTTPDPGIAPPPPG